MKVEIVKDGIRYTLSNEGLQTNDKVFPIAEGRCIGKDDWILHGFNFSEYSSGFPNRPHTIINLEYSNYKPEQVRTTYGYGPIETYYKIIKIEKQIDWMSGTIFRSKKWVEIDQAELNRINFNTGK